METFEFANFSICQSVNRTNKLGDFYKPESVVRKQVLIGMTIPTARKR